ncbi:peptidylprolyl isomerase [Thiotrichales bacterium 19S3-7]|nr:peptidylprolyl isomerase [Thiotrichales bacterium 19S3-7]MCF6800837.1 peptidylprolyl isomerase [Thiotrichales bacterium 19S3-11]
MSNKLITSLVTALSIVSFQSALANDAPKASISSPNKTTTTLNAIPQTKPAETISSNAKINVINQVVAIVNNGVITSEELDAAVEQTKAQITDQGLSLPDDLTLKRQVLQQLINQSIILELAKRNHITVTDDDINQTIAMIADQNHISVAQLKDKLKTSGLNYQQYYDTMRKQLIMQKMQQKLVAGSIFISPKDIDAYVEKHLKQPEVKQYELANILIPLPKDKTPDSIDKAKSSATKLVNEIKSGKITFFEAARKYSQSGNALSGGDLGYKTLDELPSIYADKVKAMKKGEIIGPFEANGALQILQLKTIQVKDSQKHWVEQYHVEQILLKLTPILNTQQAKAQLQRIIIALDNKKSFSELAKANTQNYDVASKGGDLGWVSLSQVSPELANVIKSTPVDTVSQPFQVGDSWQIIKVIGKRKTDDTKNYLHMQAANILFRQRAEQMVKNWQLSLRGEAYVKILIPDLNMPELDS